MFGSKTTVNIHVKGPLSLLLPSLVQVIAIKQSSRDTFVLSSDMKLIRLHWQVAIGARDTGTPPVNLRKMILVSVTLPNARQIHNNVNVY
jgi:hypothetical protein